MTPDLIATVLALSLPVRLALLDADSEGAGYFIPIDALDVRNCYVATHVTPHERGRAHDGAAWLPANPLAIVEHAARLRFGSTGWCASIVSIDGSQGEYHATVERHNESLSRKASGSCPHTAAIALLREVVGS